METYILLGSFTTQGNRSLPKGTALDRLAEAVRGAGGKLAGAFYTMGAHDVIAILSMPDGAAMAKLALSIGAEGDLRTLTLRAFDKAAMQPVLAAL
jgi:uncharacterized protein with GYD domain